MVFCTGVYRVILALFTSAKYRALKTPNTYPWIKATAVSNVASKIKLLTTAIKIKKFCVGITPLRSVKSRCPATILAANRTARVNGRIRLLVSSIKTIRGISPPGVPKGTKCLSILWGVFNQPALIWPSHKGRAIPTVKIKWLVAVKIYGKRPIKLFNPIIPIMVTGKRVSPGAVLPPRIAFNSPWILVAPIFWNCVLWGSPTQYLLHATNRAPMTESQFKCQPWNALGSKTEKRFCIIKNISLPF